MNPGRLARAAVGSLVAGLALAGAHVSTAGAQQSAAGITAPVDLTGQWVSVITEDWRWRMLTPPRGDFASVPLNDEGRRVANRWNPETDVAEGNECRAYGVGGLMRLPTRVRIEWADDGTLVLETDAGMQRRELRFGNRAEPDERSLQGHSVAEWSGTQLKVVTTAVESGYLRRNGVPYSEDAVITEYFVRHAAFGDEWFTVTTVVEDPAYLNEPFVTSSSFKREDEDTSGWNPMECYSEWGPRRELPDVDPFAG